MTLLLKNFFKLPKPLHKFDVFQSHKLQLQNLAFNRKEQYSSVAKHPIEGSKLPKKQKESSKITLFQNDDMTVTALEDAKNLAKRRSMHLVKVQDMDPKTQRPIYKLLTAAEMLENELSDRKNPNTDKSAAGAVKKAEKTLTIGSRIGEHDLTSRLKNISKWLNKQHEVRILIQATSDQDLANAEKVFRSIEENIKKPEIIGKIVQKRTKNNLIKFNIMPTSPATQNPADDSSQ